MQNEIILCSKPIVLHTLLANLPVNLRKAIIYCTWKSSNFELESRQEFDLKRQDVNDSRQKKTGDAYMYTGQLAFGKLQLASNENP